jgi:hypothetical protein
MKNYLLLSIVLFLLFNACNNTHDKDFSLSYAELQKMGMPDCDTIWSSNDFANAFSVLLKLKAENMYALPVKGSEKSGKVFAQLISRDNMSFVFIDTFGLSLRAHSILRFFNVYETLVDLYTNELMKKQYYTPELVDIYMFGLDITHNMLDLGQKINKSKISEDIELQRGYPSIQHLYIEVLSSMIDKQEKDSDFSKTELETLSTCISSSLKKNMVWFDEPTRKNIKQKLQKVVDNTSSNKIKTKYAQLIDIL